MSDIFRSSSTEHHLKILERTLPSGHISPTAPDTRLLTLLQDRPIHLSRVSSRLLSREHPSFGSKIFRGPEDQRVLWWLSQTSALGSTAS